MKSFVAMKTRRSYQCVTEDEAWDASGRVSHWEMVFVELIIDGVVRLAEASRPCDEILAMNVPQSLSDCLHDGFVGLVYIIANYKHLPVLALFPM